MSGTAMRSRVRPAIRDALNEAYACRAIDAQQLRQLLEQLQELLRERVLRFNHGQNTSLSQADWQRVCHSLDHLFARGCGKERLNGDHDLEGLLKRIIFSGVKEPPR